MPGLLSGPHYYNDTDVDDYCRRRTTALVLLVTVLILSLFYLLEKRVTEVRQPRLNERRGNMLTHPLFLTFREESPAKKNPFDDRSLS